MVLLAELNVWILAMNNNAVDCGLPPAFFDVAEQVYKHDPYWIPEERASIQQQFSSENRYFENGMVKIFIEENEARLVGFYNPKVTIEGKNAAYFGFWETKNNLQVNREIFAQFEAWAQASGAEVIYGPINFSTFQQNRLRIDDFRQSSFIDEPHNPSYYPMLMEQLGFQKKYDYVTAINSNVNQLADQVSLTFDSLMSSIPEGFSFERLNRNIWLDNLEKLYPLVDAIFKENFAYSPISWEGFQQACGERFAKKLCPNTSVIVWDKDREIAGFFITYPDYAPLVNQSAQKPESISKIDYQQHFQQLDSPKLLLAKTCGVSPKYRSFKLFPLMSMQLSLWAKGHYDHIASAMVREDNVSMSFYKGLVKAGNKDFKPRHYRLFTKDVQKSEVSHA